MIETTSKYDNFKYQENINKILIETKLSNEDYIRIDKMKIKCNKRIYNPIIEDLYKLSKIQKLTTSQLSLIYETGVRNIQLWLKELGLNRTIKESKEILKNTKYIDVYSTQKSKKETKIKRKYNNKGKDEYYNFKYKEKELKLIDDTILSKEQQNILKKIYEIWGESKYKPIIEDVYKFWISGYSPKDIAGVYGKSDRLFQNFFKKAGLSRDRFEAQAIAKQKRNYKEIMLKGRQTMIENNTNIEGSSPEKYVRTILNCNLPLAFPNYEIIVGLNNKSILDDGKEIDIPIIIINKDKILKIAVEYDGEFWHRDKERNAKKENYANEKGYKIFYIECKKNATDKQIREEINRFCEEEIIKYIKLHFE